MLLREPLRATVILGLCSLNCVANTGLLAHDTVTHCRPGKTDGRGRRAPAASPAAASSPAAAASPGAAASPAAAGASTGGAPAASASKPAVAPDYSFYAGKTVRILVPFAPGGGQDITARLFASKWGDFFPSKPNFIVENMPGAGGAVAMRDLMEKKAPDGLTLILPGSGVALRWFLKEQGHTYPMEKMRAIGALPSGPVNVVRTDAGDSLEKLIGRDKPLRSGHNAPARLDQSTAP